MASEKPLDIEALRSAYIGQESPPAVAAIEKGRIKAFAQAIEDPNALWSDEVQARRSSYGGLIAPPTFLRSVPTERLQQSAPDIPLTRLLDGGSEWEYFEPVRAGDHVTAVSRVVDVFNRTGRLGQMLFIITQTTYTNQLKQLVATQKNTMIRY